MARWGGGWVARPRRKRIDVYWQVGGGGEGVGCGQNNTFRNNNLCNIGHLTSFISSCRNHFCAGGRGVAIWLPMPSTPSSYGLVF